MRPREDESARRLRRALVTLTIVALAALAGVGFVAWSNYDRAKRRERRAVRLQHNADELNSLLIDRSDRLNARTRELNAMALKVTEAENTIVRSEADVSALEQRQRALANEKAQVEDERAAMAEERDAITHVASAYITCKNGLVDLLQYVTNGDYTSASYYADSVDSDCSDAEASLQKLPLDVQRLMRPLVLLSLTLLLAGCAGYADAPRGSDPTVTAPPLTAVSADVPAVVRAPIPRIASQSIERHAEAADRPRAEHLLRRHRHRLRIRPRLGHPRHQPTRPRRSRPARGLDVGRGARST